MSRHVAACLLSLLGALLLSGEARAGVVASATYAPQQGPVIAGSRLVYVPSTVGSEPDSVAIDAAQDGRTATIARLPAQRHRSDGGPQTDRAAWVLVAADGAGVTAIVNTLFSFANGRSGDVGQVLSQSWAAGADGRFAAVSPACPQPRLTFPAIGGSLAVSIGSSCGALELVDVASGERRVLPSAAAAASVALAGPYTAWLDGGGSPSEGLPGFAVVADAQGTELTRVPITFLSYDQRLMLDPDGTLAVFGRVEPTDPDVIGVAVARPGAAALSRIPTPVGWEVRGARLAGGRLAVLLERQGGRGTGEILLMDSDGGHPRTLLRGVAALGQDGFAFDGTEVAAVVSRCDGVQLIRVRADASATRPLGDDRCRLELERRPRWEDKGLRIAVACRGLQHRCEVDHMQARLGGPRGALLGMVSANDQPFLMPVRRALRKAVSGRTIKVYLRAVLADVAGPTQPRTTTTTVPPAPAR